MRAGVRLIERHGDDGGLVETVHGPNKSLLAIAAGYGEQREVAQAGMLEQVRALRQGGRAPEKQQEAGGAGCDGGAIVRDRKAGDIRLRERG